jgi:hypothetical protein
MTLGPSPYLYISSICHAPLKISEFCQSNAVFHYAQLQYLQYYIFAGAWEKKIIKSCCKIYHAFWTEITLQNTYYFQKL